ncbi:hypothetical protein [Hymenobacter sp. BRD67]|uniref:hypothetical protein n=2 Tax=Hymenobacter TaxID=89966 RepID=UPI001567C51E|nr:hypothetical protein [Hymenobacter sp. BRD67]QKG52875.1 hypothetical protein GKZ67_10000 [Hymenobacter sp. BRD67]
MENGTVTIPRPLNQSGSNVNNPESIAVDGTMGNSANLSGQKSAHSRKMHKDKGSMSDGKTKVKTKM